MCNLPGVSCAGRERRGPGKERRGGVTFLPQVPLTSKVKDPDRSPGRGLPGRRRGSHSRPRTLNLGSPGLRTFSLHPEARALEPRLPQTPTPAGPSLFAPEPRAPHSQSPASPARTRAPPGSRAHPVGALGEPVHPPAPATWLQPPGGRTREDALAFVAARPWRLWSAGARLRGLKRRLPPQPSAGKRKPDGPAAKTSKLEAPLSRPPARN